MKPVQAYIGIGSNLADPGSQVRRALQALDTLPHSRCTARSPLYRSKPLGPPEQPDYLNAVAELVTELPALALLAALQTIENNHGRVRSQHWGPRTLDLDILLYGDLIVHEPCLTIPHPRLPERAFVLYPLRDIAPALKLPDGRELQTLLQCCPPWELERLEESE
jgi:2-amino-4-hydroxy-6-hydroxymethyldihydropteridine diphosphokinase